MIIDKKVLLDFKKHHDKDFLSAFINIEKFNPILFNNFESHLWHKKQVEKRCVYKYVYEYVLRHFPNKKESVLDIGGGITAFTTVLAAGTKYTLCEPQLTKYDLHNINTFLRKKNDKITLITKDWLTINTKYDCIIANDIFPNVDQRLSMFLKHFIPRCKTMRLSLTYYNNDKFYVAKRDCGEVLTVKAWDAGDLYRVLKPYEDRLLEGVELKAMEKATSIFKNGRKVMVIKMIGNL